MVSANAGSAGRRARRESQEALATDRRSEDVSGPDARGSGWRHRIAATAEAAAREAAAERAVSRAEHVVAATRELIAETGTTSFTVQDIARRANVSLSTVYASFSGKDELLLAALEEAVGVATDRLRTQLERYTDPLERLRVAIVGPLLFATGPDRPTEAPALARERDRLGDLFPIEAQAATDQLVDVLRAELVAAADEGLLTPVDASRDATTIYNIWTTQLRDLWRAERFDEVDAEADYLWEVCCRLLHISSGGAPEHP